LRFLRWIFVFVLCTAPLTAHCGLCQADSTDTLYCNQPGNPDSCNIGDYAAFTTGIVRCEFDGRWVDGSSDVPVLECVTLCKNLNNLLYMWVDDELYVYRRVYKERTVSPLSDFARCDKNKTNANFFLHNNNRDKSKSWYVTCSTEPVSTQTQPQNTSNKITINGVVKNRNGEVLSGALVEVSNTQKVKTDSNGKFKLNDVDKTKNVNISHDGCAIVGRKADTLQNATVELTCVASQPSGQSGSAGSIVTAGHCMTKEGSGSGNFCWCDSHIDNSLRCRFSHLFNDQAGKCKGSNAQTVCDNFCKGKASEMQRICECMEGGQDKSVCANNVDPANPECGVIGKKECNTNYKICEKNGETRDCTGNMLLPHTTEGKCVAANRTGYKICISTKCEDNYEASQGFCKKKTNTPTSKVTITATLKHHSEGTDKVIHGAKIIVNSQVTDTVTDENGKFKLSDIDSNALLGISFPGCDYEAFRSVSDYINEDYNSFIVVCGDCMESGGTPGENDECICNGENLQQSGDKKTCVASDTEQTGEEPVSADDVDEDIGVEAPPELPCGGGTQNEDGTCDCNADDAHLVPTEDGSCDCADGYHRDEANACIENTEETPNPTNDPIVTTSETTSDLDNMRRAPTELNELKQAEDKYKKAKENEQSLANRTLTAASTAATGLGLMTAASAYSEKQADEAAEQDMSAYLATFRCEYGKGQSSKAGNEEITLPGGNELLGYYSEYKSLADNLKNTKKALGMRPGIEQEVVYDKAESGLYKYASTGITDGAFTSLSRALTDTEGKDATEWNEQKDKTAKKLKGGAIAAGAGVAGGVAGDALINTDMIQNIKDAFKK